MSNSNVVGIPFNSREIKFKYIFKTYDGRFIVKIFTLKELEYGGLQNFLSGLNDIIIVAKRQYTGLKDKTGKEIYEGDTLKMYAGRKELLKNKFKVVFINGAFGFQILNSNLYSDFSSFIKYSDDCYNNGYDDDISNYIKVIGNVFENA
ncbi:MAG TPA: YopX family protein [Agriterribacter sp.]|uniref:YopX family protein n=1 Tax=Agriterribacter sp. TaxID=2821509 RepID=UPI002C032EF2|nr:YopX family protein [Agriterribacter sp.]HRQ17744.1 YopX family protein [Agriterribacter sp.]